jgi:phosphatase NudJ
LGNFLNISFMPRIFSQTFCAVGALIEKDGKIALVQEQAEGMPDHGKWNQPAGWLDVGENPIVGAKREVEEETGFTFTPTAILRIYSLVRKDIEEQCNGTPHAIKIIFVGDVKTDGQKNFHSDISDLRWFTPEEIYAMDSSTLRDIDIKQLVRDYFDGKRYPLELIQHTIQNKS